MAHTVTDLLESWSLGDAEVADELFPLIYGELKRIALGQLKGQGPGHTLQPTALVHEAYCRLIEQRAWGWKNRRHFYAIAAKMMRRILVDHARHMGYQKRGGGWTRVSIDEATELGASRRDDWTHLEEALEGLEQLDARKAQIIDLRYFVGLNSQEIAELLGISTATITRQWLAAKAWLLVELKGDDST